VNGKGAGDDDGEPRGVGRAGAAVRPYLTPQEGSFDGARRGDGSEAVPGWLRREARVVWLEDPAGLSYVREQAVWVPTRRGRVAWRRVDASPAGARLVGYTELRPDAPRERTWGDDPRRFRRRVFYVLAHDRDGVAPAPVMARPHAPREGVDPSTVAPGEPGHLTPRAWGGPLPEGMRVWWPRGLHLGEVI
jgi:hypothetical protein